MPHRRSSALLALVALAAIAAPAAVAVPARTFAVRAVDFKFVGIPARVAPGVHTFRVVNRGGASHDLRLAGKKTRILNPGQSATLRVTLKRGRYPYLCTVPGHSALGMKGTLVVR
jgi:plastocyanin